MHLLLLLAEEDGLPFFDVQSVAVVLPYQLVQEWMVMMIPSCCLSSLYPLFSLLLTLPPSPPFSPQPVLCQLTYLDLLRSLFCKERKCP